MMLWESMAVPCVMRIKQETADGQGGHVSAYVDGTAFSAAIVKNTSFEARIAEKQVGAATYTITSLRSMSYHETFKRVSDGAKFRVTSKGENSAPPAAASFTFYQATAEEWTE